MGAVVTRRGIFTAVLLNHLKNAFIDFFIILIAFKWLYNGKVGIYLLFVTTTFIYMSGIYSYSHSQAKCDFRNKKRYDWLSPLKIGAAAFFMILIPALLHRLLLAVFPVAGEYFGIAARLWNYPFFFFIYGRNGDYFNPAALTLIALIPIAAAYFAYYCGIKKFSFSDKIYNIIHKPE